ncbi:hypothetical protein EB796_016647 [Bugula neritina]|uniref:Lipase domain-containing protein n=1 Tax=Bugula neritina TaxID=10212 RepID=A0A7J7JFM3_BUGNE|nr:hypothetical protein EB796_016647 [Bugula neritina]
MFWSFYRFKIIAEGLPRSFNPKAKTYFIIHGWNGGNVEGWVKKMIDALLKKEDANIFSVNWETWAKTPNYLEAQKKADDAGDRLSSFIKSLERKTGTSRTRMHLIGHSLGGQVAGFAGEKLQSPKVARITGLDTSGIGFGCLFSNKNCLDPSDAEFVDEIHSLISALPKGHADFYPMPKDPLQVLIDTKLVKAHNLAIDYFIQSIKAGQCAFKSHQCSSHLSFYNGKCRNTNENRVGFYASKPSTKPPNMYFLTIDVDNPCK